MKQVKYILINETGSENTAAAIRNCHLPDIGQHIALQGGLPQGELIGQLCALRRHWPDAKILGLSELAPYCVHPSERMNALRRLLSDLP